MFLKGAYRPRIYRLSMKEARNKPHKSNDQKKNNQFRNDQRKGHFGQYSRSLKIIPLSRDPILTGKVKKRYSY